MKSFIFDGYYWKRTPYLFNGKDLDEEREEELGHGALGS